MPDRDLRCSAASLADAEPLAGTAPTDRHWLFVEHPGPWGRQAVAESRLAPHVRDYLGGLDDVRVQLIRRPGGAVEDRLQVYAARLGDVVEVWEARVDTPDDLEAALTRPLRALVSGDEPDLARRTSPDPLWMVCTNGRRDRCCAELGRPVAGALAERWPEATWETTHLGGHRFAGTLLALPSGLVLGRLSEDDAVEVCAEVAAGRVPVDHCRGRAGLTGVEQVAELHVRRGLGLVGVPDVAVVGSDGSTVDLDAPDGRHRVEVEQRPGVPRAQSCGDARLKAAPEHVVVSWRRP